MSDSLHLPELIKDQKYKILVNREEVELFPPISTCFNFVVSFELSTNLVEDRLSLFKI